MPSGAKKRKAAKKKLQKEAKNNGARPHQGNDETKSHDERDSDGGEVEREPSEEPVEHHGGEGAKEVRLEEENGAEVAGEVKQDENFNDVAVEADNVFRESRNVEESGERKSSSSSSLDDDEVAVEKEKPVSVEEEKVEEQNQGSAQETAVSNETPTPADGLQEVVSGEKSVSSEVVQNSVEESIPIEESVKEVVSSLPQELNAMTECIPSETSEAVQAELKKSVDEKSVVSDENGKVSSGKVDLLQEKIETKMVPIVDGAFGHSSEPADSTAGDENSVLPQSSGVETMDRSCGDNHVQDSEKHKDPERQPLVSSAPMPVRRTSLIGCCGLFEVLAGGSSR